MDWWHSCRPSAGRLCRKPNRFRILDEIDIAESAEAWLRHRKTEIAEGERNDILQSLMASMDSLAMQGEQLMQQVNTVEEDQSEPLEEVTEPTGTDETKVKRQSGFIIVTTGRNCKRLHKAVGGCWMAREKIFKDSQEFEDKPEEQSLLAKGSRR
jgi:hypothetical protein